MWLLFFYVMFNTYPVHLFAGTDVCCISCMRCNLPSLPPAAQHKRCLPQVITRRYEQGWDHATVGCHAMQGSSKAREVRTALSKRIKDAMTDAFSWYQDAAMVTKWGPSVYYWEEVDGSKELQMNQEVALALAEGKFLSVMQTYPGNDYQTACQLPSLSWQRNLHCSPLTKHTPTVGMMHTASGTV